MCPISNSNEILIRKWAFGEVLRLTEVIRVGPHPKGLASLGRKAERAGRCVHSGRKQPGCSHLHTAERGLTRDQLYWHLDLAWPSRSPELR